MRSCIVPQAQDRIGSIGILALLYVGGTPVFSNLGESHAQPSESNETIYVDVPHAATGSEFLETQKVTYKSRYQHLVKMFTVNQHMTGQGVTPFQEAAYKYFKVLCSYYTFSAGDSPEVSDQVDKILTAAYQYYQLAPPHRKDLWECHLRKILRLSWLIRGCTHIPRTAAICQITFAIWSYLRAALDLVKVPERGNGVMDEATREAVSRLCDREAEIFRFEDFPDQATPQSLALDLSIGSMSAEAPSQPSANVHLGSIEILPHDVHLGNALQQATPQSHPIDLRISSKGGETEFLPLASQKVSPFMGPLLASNASLSCRELSHHDPRLGDASQQSTPQFCGFDRGIPVRSGETGYQTSSSHERSLLPHSDTIRLTSDETRAFEGKPDVSGQGWLNSKRLRLDQNDLLFYRREPPSTARFGEGSVAQASTSYDPTDHPTVNPTTTRHEEERVEEGSHMSKETPEERSETQTILGGLSSDTALAQYLWSKYMHLANALKVFGAAPRLGRFPRSDFRQSVDTCLRSVRDFLSLNDLSRECISRKRVIRILEVAHIAARDLSPAAFQKLFSALSHVTGWLPLLKNDVSVNQEVAEAQRELVNSCYLYAAYNEVVFKKPLYRVAELPTFKGYEMKPDVCSAMLKALEREADFIDHAEERFAVWQTLCSLKGLSGNELTSSWISSVLKDGEELQRLVLFMESCIGKIATSIKDGAGNNPPEGAFEQRLAEAWWCLVRLYEWHVSEKSFVLKDHVRWQLRSMWRMSSYIGGKNLAQETSARFLGHYGIEAFHQSFLRAMSGNKELCKAIQEQNLIETCDAYRRMLVWCHLYAAYEGLFSFHKQLNMTHLQATLTKLQSHLERIHSRGLVQSPESCAKPP